MKLIIAGPRDYTDYEGVEKEVLDYIFKYAQPHEKIIILSGSCSDSKNGKLTFTRKDGTEVFGVDGLGERFAHKHGYEVKYFVADWKTHGKSAGPIRNTTMSKAGTDALIWTRPTSKGSNDMLKKAIREIGESKVKEVKI